MLLLAIVASSFPQIVSAQEVTGWEPTGNERWIFQNYETTLTRGGLILDTDWNRALVPGFVVIPLYSSDPDVDPLTTKDIDRYHEQNIRVVCSVVAGYWDRNAPDSTNFTPSMIGRSVWGDADRRWLDVRNTGVRDLIATRIAVAASIGCDAIDASYLELWYQNTGFFITYGDQLAFNRFLADSAHALGLAIALHNTTQQINDLVGWYDFAIAEGCSKPASASSTPPSRRSANPSFMSSTSA